MQIEEPHTPEEETPTEEKKPTEEKIIEPKSGKKTRSRPVTVYLTVMFAAAFFLLLISFFMQQRNHQAIMDLNVHVDTAQSVTELELEKQRLEFELADLKEDQETLKQEQETLSSQLDDQKKQTQAMEWLREIEAAYRSSYSRTVELVTQFQATGLQDSLPQETPVEGALSPAEIYRNIVDNIS